MNEQLKEDLVGYSLLTTLVGSIALAIGGIGIAGGIYFLHWDLSSYLAIGMIIGGIVISAVILGIANIRSEEEFLSESFTVYGKDEYSDGTLEELK